MEMGFAPRRVLFGGGLYAEMRSLRQDGRVASGGRLPRRRCTTSRWLREVVQDVEYALGGLCRCIVENGFRS